jgi:Uma2 family endonuclease
MSVDSPSFAPLAERLARLPSSLTVDEYHRAVYAGTLHEDDPVELIEGRLVVRQPIGSRHAATVTRLGRLLTRAVGDHAVVWVGNPVRLSTLSEPQPDLMLLKPRGDDYAEALPSPGEALLLVEVADSTLQFDRTVKVPLYGRHGIPEVWLVDLVHHRLVAYRDPFFDGYRSELVLGAGEVAPELLPQAKLSVEHLLR